MNTQKGFSTLLGLLLVLLIVGGGAYLYIQTEILNNKDNVQVTSEPITSSSEISEKKKPMVDVKMSESIIPKVTQKQFIDPGRNFYFYHDFEKVDEIEKDGGQIGELSGLGGEYPEDIITVIYRGEKTFEDEDAKFGPYRLRYNEEKKCWESYSESAKGELSGVIFACTQPAMYTDSGLPIFVSTVRWRTYVIPIEKDEFVRLNISGSGSTKPLDDIVKSVHKI